MGKRTTPNLRIYKKKAKAAMAALIKDHGIDPDAFFFAQKGDELGYEAFGVSGGAHPLPGTPMNYSSCSYTGGFDAYCCVAWLKELELWSTMTSDEVQEMLEGE